MIYGGRFNTFGHLPIKGQKYLDEIYISSDAYLAEKGLVL